MFADTTDFVVGVDGARSCGLDGNCLRIAILSSAHMAESFVVNVLT